MPKPTEVLLAQVKAKAADLAGVTASDVESFVAPAVRDLDLAVTTEDPATRDQLSRSLHEQITNGVPELVRVTGSREAAQLVANLTLFGADLLVGLASKGVLSITEALDDGGAA